MKQSLSKTPNPYAYYADFVVYPLVVLALLASYWVWAYDSRPVVWLAAILVGGFVWTLMEYFIHRVILHHAVYVRDMHEMHHRAPTELIDTPIWMSLSFMLVGVLLLPWLVFGFGIASGFTIGMTIGYLAYGTMHHAMHHWRIRHGTYLYRAKRRHAQHHASLDEGNYGVSSPLWDYVFGTLLPDPAKSRKRDKGEA
jgi:sterol desaturase/sphingolipid hydroxylase (fatty acid hydroxylase superfamily)